MEAIDLILKNVINKHVVVFFGSYTVENEQYSEIVIYGIVQKINGRWIILQEDDTDNILYINTDHIEYLTVLTKKQKIKPRIEELKLQKHDGGRNLEI